MIIKKLLTAIAVTSICLSSNVIAGAADWTAAYQINDTMIISHSPNRTCLGFMCAGQGIQLSGSQVNGVYFNNLSLETDSTQAEFENAIRRAGFDPVRVS